MMGCMCKRCHGVIKLVVGALFLANYYVWPKLSGVDGWLAFFGWLMVIGGFVKLVVPNKCKSCAQMCGVEMPKASSGKKK